MKKIIIAAFGLVLLGSCAKDFSNKDPKAPSVVPSYTLFSNAVKELSDQLDAVDKALAALSEPHRVPRTGSEGNPQRAAGETVTEVLPTRLKPPKQLSDEHRHALKEGRRRARNSKEVAAGRAREIPDPRPGLASASSADDRRPRLVKQRKR